MARSYKIASNTTAWEDAEGTANAPTRSVAPRPSGQAGGEGSQVVLVCTACAPTSRGSQRAGAGQQVAVANPRNPSRVTSTSARRHRSSETQNSCAHTHTYMHDHEVADERRLDHQAKNCTEKYKTPSFDDNQGRRTKAKTSWRQSENLISSKTCEGLGCYERSDGVGRFARACQAPKERVRAHRTRERHTVGQFGKKISKILLEANF